MVRPNGRTMYDWAKNTIGSSQLTKDVLGPAIGSIIKSSIYNEGRKNSLNDITPQIRGANGEVYIPGSSIKGVIDSAIISHMLRNNKAFRSNVQRELRKVLDVYKRKNAGSLFKDIFKMVNQAIIKHIHVLTNNDGKPLKGILASAFRGISVSDAMPMSAIQTEVLKKEDSCVDEDGTHEISVHREWILMLLMSYYLLNLRKLVRLSLKL